MVDTDMIFRFVFPSEADCDMRTFRIYQVIGGTAHEELVLYKVRQCCLTSMVLNALKCGSSHIRRLVPVHQVELLPITERT
jgi:hypothetical protein